MMKIIRYSFHGFKPQYQSYHLKQVNFHLFNFNMDDCPEHLKPFVLQRHNELLLFYKRNYEDFRHGIWAFIDGYKNNQFLNHLKRPVPCCSAVIPDDTMVYDVNWDCKYLITDPMCKHYGFYLPQRVLHKITN